LFLVSLLLFQNLIYRFLQNKSPQFPIFYIVIIGMTFFAPKEFIPTAFDSGGVTTGPITVPFIMALGAGLATNKKGKNTGEHSFGL